MFRKILCVTLAATLCACGSNIPGPNSDAIDSSLAMDLPAGVAIDDIDVEVAENVGSEVEPIYRTRSNVVLTLMEDFYEREGTVNDKAIVKK